MYQLLSWVFSFGLGKITNTLWDKMFSVTFNKQLDETVADWAGSLPDNLSTTPEVFFYSEENKNLGPAQRKLFTMFSELREIPTTDIWYGALFETWQEKHSTLGDEANPFIRQDAKSVEKHLRSLAKSLNLVCAQNNTLFNVTVLGHIEDMKNTQSEIISKVTSIENQNEYIIKSINPNQINHINPYKPKWNDLCAINRIVLVDDPTIIISGSLREYEAWVGLPNSLKEDAAFTPPSPIKLNNLMSRFFEHWETNYSRFDSADTSEQIKAIVDFHHQLLAIHPFENGNGRVARAISDLQIQKCFRVNRKLNLKDSENYYSSLSIADGGNMDAMFRLFESLLYPQ